MKKPYGISLDPAIWTAAKRRAQHLHMSGAAYLEQLIRQDLSASKHGGGLHVVAEQAAIYGGQIHNHLPKKGAKKK